MEKLLELLNECTNGRFKSEDDLRLCIEMRGYCRNLIKRLIENDKIDLDKIKEIGIKHNGKMDIDGLYRFPVYERLLMLLAIQDEPIQFLTEILKQETHQP